jgi:hypothetical protein
MDPLSFFKFLNTLYDFFLLMLVIIVFSFLTCVVTLYAHFAHGIVFAIIIAAIAFVSTAKIVWHMFKILDPKES